MKTITDNLRDCADHYGNLAKTLGPSAKAAGWRDEETQFLRFAQLYKIIDPSLKDFTIADVGCGFGALLEAMPQNLKSNLARYDGYDISEDMIKAAQKKHKGNTKARFIQNSKITTPVDYCVESGIFNHHFDADRNEWKKHIQNTIKHMVENAKRGVAFNIMSNRVDYEEGYIYYADPAELLTFCLENFGRHVQLIHDYPLYEFTVLIRKQGA